MSKPIPSPIESSAPGGPADGLAVSGPQGLPDCRLGDRELSRLRWRCRRGLLENDLFIERFFRRHEATITTWQAEGLQALMDLADNDLLDLLLARKDLSQALDRPAVREVLNQLRQRPLATH